MLNHIIRLLSHFWVSHTHIISYILYALTALVWSYMCLSWRYSRIENSFMYNKHTVVFSNIPEEQRLLTAKVDDSKNHRTGIESYILMDVSCDSRRIWTFNERSRVVSSFGGFSQGDRQVYGGFGSEETSRWGWKRRTPRFPHRILHLRPLFFSHQTELKGDERRRSLQIS